MTLHFLNLTHLSLFTRKRGEQLDRIPCDPPPRKYFARIQKKSNQCQQDNSQTEVRASPKLLNKISGLCAKAGRCPQSRGTIEYNVDALNLIIMNQGIGIYKSPLFKRSKLRRHIFPGHRYAGRSQPPHPGRPPRRRPLSPPAWGRRRRSCALT